MASIVVSGRVLRRPLGPSVAAHLHYLIGLRKLGHRVLYLEERGSSQPSEGDAVGESGVPRAGLVLLRNLLRRCRVDIPVVWVDADAGLVGGMVWAQLRKRLSKADLLLDLGGHCWLEERSLAGRRVLVDVDSDPFQEAGRQLDHDVCFSYRRSPDGPAGVDWLPTIPPVVPRLWYGPPAESGMPLQAFAEMPATTVSPAGPSLIEELLELPGRVSAPLGITLSKDEPDLGGRLARAGWSVRNAAAVNASLSSYRAHVIGSRAALSFRDPAAGGDRGIWFSGRCACFLAAGRPVIVGDTSLDSWLPTGSGVLTFGNLDEAAAAVERVRHGLAAHSLAARAVAQRVFHYRVVLPSLLEQALPRHLEAVA